MRNPSLVGAGFSLAPQCGAEAVLRSRAMGLRIRNWIRRRSVAAGVWRRVWPGVSGSARLRLDTKLAYYGHHRCGSQWISEILQEVCDMINTSWVIEDHAMRVPNRLYNAGSVSNNTIPEWFLICWNSDYLYINNLERLGFHVIRDPRDVIVSGYFSHLYSHEVGDWPRLRVYRQMLENLNKEDGLLAEMQFSSIYLYQMYSWNYNQPRILEKKFEDLISNTIEQFQQIFAHLRVVPDLISDEDLIELLDKFSFEKLSGGRQVGSEDTRGHYRKGVVGDWRNHFSERHIACFKALYNPILLACGYETKENW